MAFSCLADLAGYVPAITDRLRHLEACRAGV